MSLKTTEDGTPVHFPADPGKFVFDKEVSAVFDDMARRSIPNFYEAHAAHASMLRDRLLEGCSIMDIGASRGAFFRAIREELGAESLAQGAVSLSAIDNSLEMCNYLRQDFPNADVQCLDIASPTFLAWGQTYDVVCAHYVLQFIRPEHQVAVMLQMFKMVKPGGIFIFGHKSAHYGIAGDMAHEQYIRFRLKNGYTREEIEAKTAALRNSMFPMNHDRMVRAMNQHFHNVQETFRFMMFSTVMAVK